MKEEKLLLIYDEQKNLVQQLKNKTELINLEGIKESFFTPPPLLSTMPKFIFVGLEPSLDAKQFIKNIDWFSSFDNYILHYAAWIACGKNFDYHFTDVSKLSMSATNASKSRKHIFKYFIELFIKELILLKFW